MKILKSHKHTSQFHGPDTLISPFPETITFCSLCNHVKYIINDQYNFLIPGMSITLYIASCLDNQHQLCFEFPLLW